MGWERIVGHDRIKAWLRQGIERRRAPHAVAFVGPEGVGKATTAKVYAKALLCPAGGEPPCGACASCLRVDRGAHPDLRWVEPEEATLKIGQVRELQNGLALKPFEAERSVAVIDGAERMTTEAQNALLKTLEEPPGDAVIVLVASNAAALLPTIRSRCQQLRFQPLPVETVASHLTDLGADPDRAKLLASLVEGRIGAALAAMDSDLFDVRDRVAEWVGALASPGGKRAAISIGREWEEERDRTAEFLNLFLLWLRDLLALKEGAPEAIANQDAVAKLESQAAGVSSRGLFAAMKAVDHARRRLAAHANFRLTIDLMLASVQRSFAS